MALTKPIVLTNNFGTETKFDTPYIKIVRLSGYKERMNAEVTFYASNGGSPLQTQIVSFVPNLDGENFIKQAYEYLKALSEFAGAKDC